MKRKWRDMRMHMKTIQGRTLVSGAVVCMVIVLVLSCVFFFRYRDMVAEDYNTLARTRLQDTREVVGQYIDSVNSLARGWFESAGCVACRVKDDFRFADATSFVYDLQKSLNHIGYIQSVYFLNRQNQVPLWVMGHSPYTEALEEMLIARLQSAPRQSPFYWTVKNRYAGREDVHLLTVVYAEMPLNAPNHTGAIIINIDMDKFAELVLSQNTGDADGQAIFMLDGSGNVVLHNDKRHIGENWAGSAAVRQILAREDDAFCQLTEGEMRYFSMRSSDGKWAFAMETRHTVGYRLMRRTAVYLFAIGIAVSAIAVAVIFARGKRLFRPLNTVLNDLRASEFLPQGEKEAYADADRDEVAFLRSYDLHISRRMQTMNSRVNHDYVVKNLLLGENGESIQAHLLEKGVLLRGRAYCVIALEMWNGGASAHFAQGFGFIRDMHIVSLEKLGQLACYELSAKRFVFFLTETGEKRFSAETLRETLESAHALTETPGTRVLCVVSRRVSDADMPTSEILRELNERLRVNRVFGGGVAFCEETRADDDARKQACMAAMTECLKKRDQSGYMRAATDLLDALKHGAYRQMLADLALSREQALALLAPLKGKKEGANRDAVWREAENIADYAGLLGWFSGLYNEVTGAFQKAEGQTASLRIEDAVAYIQAHYGDSTLSANTLADRLHISAAYFGQLFRGYTGESIPDYVIRVRMEKAREMLGGKPNMDIAEVARRTGYNNSSYFTATFKKFYGVSPSKFRMGGADSEDTDA